MSDHLIAKGKAVIESGQYTPPPGDYLGRIEYWGVDVHEHSPQPWIDALMRESGAAAWR